MRASHQLLFPAFLLLLAGCGIVPIYREAAPLPQRPYLLHFPGIAGDNPFDRAFLSALRDGGFDAEVHLCDWTVGRSHLAALQDEAANRTEAAKIAQMIEKQRRAEPARPIYLTSESAGAGVAVWALELLPAGVQVDGVILMAPAFSPDYDLSTALMHVRQKMLVYHSKLDWFTLGIGTSVFGTLDRRNTQAAGRVGFVRPPQADPVQYGKLEQVPFRGRWMWQYGHDGGHIGPLRPRFASGHLALRLTSLATQPASAPPEPAYP